ncbi:MAG: biotin/lipoyl-containing protein, partial [Acidimicrobiales bacterium]
MPSLGADMVQGTVVEWLVAPGDAVRRGDVVAVIDTEKADIEAEIFEAGVIAEILVPVGETVAVGTPLAMVAPAV